MAFCHKIYTNLLKSKLMHRKYLAFLITVLLGIFTFLGCQPQSNDVTYKPSERVVVENSVYPEVQRAVLYEVNVRQYTPQGTFKAFEKHLPRLKQMGVDILWFMPIYPIGIKNRKGTLGSYYSVRDYYGVNPEFGTKQDFKQLVEKAHQMGFMVILDWVANHTAWDNPWITEHPDWYVHDSTGHIVSPYDWTDVAKLDYSNQQLRDSMIAAMKYWVENFDIDGFRCDVAGEVPTSFWEQARVELEKVKPLFMLAEAEEPGLVCQAFDAYYGWHLLSIMNRLSQGKTNVLDLKNYFLTHAQDFPSRAIRMNFTSNHDENSWNGTVFERMPHSYKTFAVFTFVVPGLPLIYSGQEACLNKRLRFFDKDTIQWRQCDMTKLYKQLIVLKHTHPALLAGKNGGEFKILPVTNAKRIFAFIRKKDNDQILALFNLSEDTVRFKLRTKVANGLYSSYFDSTEVQVDSGKVFKFAPWQYQILIKRDEK